MAENDLLKDRLNDLKDSAAKLADGEYVWVGPDDGKAFAEDENQKFIDAFNRDELSADFLKAIGPEGKASDAQLLKAKSDMLAAMERELRMRYRSRVRMFAHARARVRSAGENGGIFDTIAQQQFSREGSG